MAGLVPLGAQSDSKEDYSSLRNSSSLFVIFSSPNVICVEQRGVE